MPRLSSRPVGAVGRRRVKLDGGGDLLTAAAGQRGSDMPPAPSNRLAWALHGVTLQEAWNDAGSFSAARHKHARPRNILP